MTVSVVPPLNTRGIYTLRAPWVSDFDHVYQCIGIQRFAALGAKNIDVYSTYYQPLGIERSVYEADLAAGAALITLTTDYAAPIYVPSTYITSYPNMGNVVYSHVVLSVSLGSLPDGIALDGVQEQIRNSVAAVIGVDPTVLVNTAPIKGVVSSAQHQDLEATRNAAITNRSTSASTIVQLQAQIAALQAANNTLTQIAIDNGWVGNAT